MTPAPKWFVPVAVLALLWNLFGCFQIGMNFLMTDADIAKLTAEEQAIVAAMPSWLLIGSALGVVGGALGSLGLVLKRRWATPLLMLSVLGLVVQDIGFALVARTAPIPTAGWILQGVVFVIAVLLVVLSRKAAANGWLR
jgi:hypothetical protein